MADVLEGWQEHSQHILNQLKPGKDDAFLLQQSMEDAKNGFCTPPLRRAEFFGLHRRTRTSSHPTLCHHPELRQAEGHRQW